MARTVWGRNAIPSPVPAARVTADGPQRRSVMTGADGRYSLADLPRGLYTVSVAWPGALPQLGELEPEPLVLDIDIAYACAELDFVAPIRARSLG